MFNKLPTPQNTLNHPYAQQIKFAMMIQDTEKAASYRSALAKSEVLSLDVLQKLSAFTDENVDELLTDRHHTLQKLKKELILDTAHLLKMKNSFKNECYDASVKNVEKVRKFDSVVNNPLLLKWQIQVSKNNEAWNTLYQNLRKMPMLKLDVIKDSIDLPAEVREQGESTGEDVNIDAMDVDTSLEDDSANAYIEFINSLDVSPEAIKLLVWNDEPLEARAETKDAYMVPDDTQEIIQKLVKESDVKKFRLVQLHDKYYQRRLQSLKAMDEKWSGELNKVKSFVSADVGGMKMAIEAKMLDVAKESESERRGQGIEDLDVGDVAEEEEEQEQEQEREREQEQEQEQEQLQLQEEEEEQEQEQEHGHNEYEDNGEYYEDVMDQELEPETENLVEERDNDSVLEEVDTEDLEGTPKQDPQDDADADVDAIIEE